MLLMVYIEGHLHNLYLKYQRDAKGTHFVEQPRCIYLPIFLFFFYICSYYFKKIRAEHDLQNSEDT